MGHSRVEKAASRERILAAARNRSVGAGWKASASAMLIFLDSEQGGFAAYPITAQRQPQGGQDAGVKRDVEDIGRNAVKLGPSSRSQARFIRTLDRSALFTKTVVENTKRNLTFASGGH